MNAIEGSALQVRGGLASDLSALAAFALRSKGHRGYPSGGLATMRDELTWDEADLVRMCFRSCGNAAGAVGFSAVEPLVEDRGELEALCVAPEHIGSGVGQALMDDAKVQARRLRCRLLRIQADPHAERFWLAAGARRVVERPSASLPGRVLPLLALELAP